MQIRSPILSRRTTRICRGAVMRVRSADGLLRSEIPAKSIGQLPHCRPEQVVILTELDTRNRREGICHSMCKTTVGIGLGDAADQFIYSGNLCTGGADGLQGFLPRDLAGKHAA